MRHEKTDGIKLTFIDLKKIIFGWPKRLFILFIDESSFWIYTFTLLSYINKVLSNWFVVIFQRESE